MGLAGIPTKVIKGPDAVEEMAPALTEPLSQSKLSPSAASADSPQAEVETGGTQEDVPTSVSTDSGTGTASANPSETDYILTTQEITTAASPSSSEPAVLRQTVDDIQNNNNSTGALPKIDSEGGKDLIEFALEQLHGDTQGAATEEVGENTTTTCNTESAADISQSVIAHITEVATTSEHPTTTAAQSDLQQLDSQSSIISSSSTNMGMQKDYLKENPDMEQMLGELASTSDMELLQVFKSLEGNPSGDGLCAELAGGLALFSDVDVGNIYEEVAQTTPPNKDRERLEMHEEIIKRQTQMQRKYDFLIRRLNKLQARYMGQHVSEEIAGLFEYSQRYWKKKDKEHAKGITSSSSTTAAISPTSLIPDIIPYQPPPPSSADRIKPISANAMKTFVKRLEGIATTQCSTQTKRIFGNRYFQGTASTSSDAGSTQHSSPAVTISALSTTIPKFDDFAIDQLEQTSGMLHSELKHIQQTIDSEATASSSGGESADEMVIYNNQTQQPLTITKRATWRWAKDRASVAARWTWLLAQISDLEYRIRQHNELHNKIRVNKGPVTLEDGTAASSQSQQQQQPPSQQSVNGYRGTLPGNSKSLDSMHETSTGNVAPNGAYDHSGGCCRTRPFHRNGFRKRKLLQTANLHTISKKAARPSTIKCGCAWPVHPCALCTGRQDPTAPRDLPDTMPASERVALLDSCFHPVLSFPEDVSHSIHFEAIMRIPEWQNKMIRCTAKALSRSVAQKAAFYAASSPPAASSGTLPTSTMPAFLSSGDEAVPSGSKKYGPDGKRKYNKHNKLHGSQDLANHKLKKSKLRRNLMLQGSGRKPTSVYSAFNTAGGSQYSAPGSGAIPGGSSNKFYKSSSSKYRKTSHSSSTTTPVGTTTRSQNRYSTSGGYDYADSSGVHHDGTGSGSGRSKNSSPTPNHHRNERKSRTSYDIDNIVIPQSMAASNRVEILQYKEITTPKWRFLKRAPSAVESPLNNKILEQATGSDMLDASQITKTDSGNSTGKSCTSTSSPAGEAKTADVKIEQDISSTEITIVQDTDDTLAANEDNSLAQLANEDEDISDETILAKHERALLDERKKFQSHMKFPWSRPRANRRVDSRAPSSGGNTPDPTSPAPPTPLIDHESNTSPACPSTPITPLDSQELSETNVINGDIDDPPFFGFDDLEMSRAHHSGPFAASRTPLQEESSQEPSGLSIQQETQALNQSLNKKERRRTVSNKTVREEIRRSSTPDIKEIVPPYESLQFPLPDDVYDEMIREMPTDHLVLVEDAITKLTRPNRPNNNVLLENRNNLSLGLSGGSRDTNPLSSNLSTTSTTLSATENDLDEIDCDENDDELLQAKKIENQIIMEKLLKSCDENRMYVSSQQMLEEDDDPMEDEETDTGESLFVEEDDPNDPEWYDRPGRGRT